MGLKLLSSDLPVNISREVYFLVRNFPTVAKEHCYLQSSGLLETFVCKAINQASFLWGPQLEAGVRE